MKQEREWEGDNPADLRGQLGVKWDRTWRVEVGRAEYQERHLVDDRLVPGHSASRSTEQMDLAFYVCGLPYFTTQLSSSTVLKSFDAIRGHRGCALPSAGPQPPAQHG